MSVKVDVLDFREGKDDKGEPTYQVIVQHSVPRRYKVNLTAKTTPEEREILKTNVGGTFYLDLGEMIQNGKFFHFFVEGSEIELMLPPQKSSKETPAGVIPSVSSAK